MSDRTLDSIEILSDTRNKRCLAILVTKDVVGKRRPNAYLTICRLFLPSYLFSNNQQSIHV